MLCGSCDAQRICTGRDGGLVDVGGSVQVEAGFECE